MKKVIQKYGQANILIVLLCCIALVINSMFVTKDALLEISDNILVAYVLNFLIGCQGVLGKWGSMSYEMFFEKLQVWRIITHIYLHVGVIHMIMNVVALLVIGKYVEKKLGTAFYGMIFHLIAIIDAIIVSLIFSSETVGASAGIFGIIGIAIVMILRKQILLTKSEVIYLIIFFLLSLLLGKESFVIHITATILGSICGLLIIREKRL